MSPSSPSVDPVDLLPDLLLTVDRSARVLHCRAGGRTAHLLSTEGLAGRFLAELFDPEVGAEVGLAVEHCCSSGTSRTVDAELRHGNVASVELRVEPVDDCSALVIIRDVTDKRRDETELSRAQAELEDRLVRRSAELQLLARVFERCLEGIVITDAKATILRVNEAFEAMTGFTAEEAIGKTPRILKSELHDDAFYRAMWSSLTADGEWRGSIWNRRKDGEVFPCWQSISAVRDERGRTTHFVSVASDVSQLKRTEERLERLATHDPLTGLPNRLLFNDRLAQAMARVARSRASVAVLFIDLNSFKPINDELGHVVGDEVLRVVAERLRRCVRRADTVARIGGDEFAAVIQVEDHRFPEVLADQLLERIAEPVRVGDHPLRIGASIGISLFPEDGDDVRTLLERADEAMYRAKTQGRRVCYYSQEADSREHAADGLARELARAVDLGQLELHYQLQFDRERRPVAAAALARWNHPVHGLLTPARFLPVAARGNLMVSITSWILHAACSQLVTWDRGPLPGVATVVKVGEMELRLGVLPRLLAEALEASKLDGRRLELAIREDALRSATDQLVASLEEIKALGVRLVLDSFGGRHSRLTTPTEIAFDGIKTDRELVAGMLHDDRNRALLAALVTLGHDLGCEMTAHGVESPAHLDMVTDLGFDRVSGFHLHPPGPAGECQVFGS